MQIRPTKGLNNHHLCGRCFIVLQIIEILEKCRGGHYISYCSEKCQKLHNHRYHKKQRVKLPQSTK